MRIPTRSSSTAPVWANVDISYVSHFNTLCDDNILYNNTLDKDDEPSWQVSLISNAEKAAFMNAAHNVLPQDSSVRFKLLIFAHVSSAK